jgi:hypothetical protein
LASSLPATSVISTPSFVTSLRSSALSGRSTPPNTANGSDGKGVDDRLENGSLALVGAEHEFAVGGAGGGQVVAAFVQLQAEVDDLPFEVDDALLERVDVIGRAEPRLAPGVPDMLRVAGSLIANQVRAYDLLRSAS